MWKLSGAAAAVAAGALLGSTAQPAADPPDRPPAAGLPHDRLVLGLHPPERVAVLDVRTGVLAERRLPGGTLCHGPLMAGTDDVVFLGSSRGRGALMSLDLGLNRRPRVLDRGAQMLLPSSRGGALWLLRFRYDGRVPRSRGFREVAAGGTVLFRSRRRPPVGYPMAASADGIVFEHRGRYRVWDPHSGALRPAPGSSLVAASADRSAWCGAHCRRLRLEGPAGPVAGRRLPRGWTFNPTSGSLSAGGSLLAVAAGRVHRPYLSRVALVSTADGSVVLTSIALGSYGEFDWSPAGEWLYVATGAGRIVAYRPRDARVVRLPVHVADDVIDLDAAPGA